MIRGFIIKHEFLQDKPLKPLNFKLYAWNCGIKKYYLVFFYGIFFSIYLIYDYGKEKSNHNKKLYNMHL